jgi:hypothetical protein
LNKSPRQEGSKVAQKKNLVKRSLGKQERTAQHHDAAIFTKT